VNGYSVPMCTLVSSVMIVVTTGCTSVVNSHNDSQRCALYVVYIAQILRAGFLQWRLLIS
jgi:hypothetical protein